jgi:hypothetical protein
LLVNTIGVAEAVTIPSKQIAKMVNQVRRIVFI